MPCKDVVLIISFRSRLVARSTLLFKHGRHLASPVPLTPLDRRTICCAICSRCVGGIGRLLWTLQVLPKGCTSFPLLKQRTWRKRRPTCALATVDYNAPTHYKQPHSATLADSMIQHLASLSSDVYLPLTRILLLPLLATVFLQMGCVTSVILFWCSG